MIESFCGYGPMASATLLAAPLTAPATTFLYDWSTANASAAGVVLDAQFAGGDNNDNWTNIAGTGTGIDDGVRNAAQPLGFAGNYYQSIGISSGDDLYRRGNAGCHPAHLPADSHHGHDARRIDEDR